MVGWGTRDLRRGIGWERCDPEHGDACWSWKGLDMWRFVVAMVWSGCHHVYMIVNVVRDRYDTYTCVYAHIVPVFVDILKFVYPFEYIPVYVYVDHIQTMMKTLDFSQSHSVYPTSVCIDIAVANFPSTSTAVGDTCAKSTKISSTSRPRVTHQKGSSHHGDENRNCSFI